jgi:protein involved in polysaccharide export with SLBB domain
MTSNFSLSRAALSHWACALLLTLSAASHAQVFVDPLNLSPRGLTDVPPARPPVPAQVPAAKASAPQPSETKALPPDPFTSAQPVVFGSQIFTGRFGSEAFSGFNPDYQIAVGDRIHIRIWGAFNFDETQPVDAQGNVFIPNVGPVSVLGVRNAELTRQVEAQAKRTFRSNVGVYATLEAAQPVKIYVTGFVRAPGLYGGLSSDSVLAYLDRAGGIDPDRGSYLEVDVLRAGKLRAKFNLYRFLLDGQIAPLQLQDGDTLVAYPRKHTVLVRGEVLNPYLFEFGKPVISAADLVGVARPRPSATHLSIQRKVGLDTRSEYHPLSNVADVTIQDGDEVLFTSDKYPGTILVRVEGAHLGERTLILPYGARLQDALARLKPAPQANVDALQLYRLSVAERQKEMLEASLRSLQTYALTSRSATSEEAALRTREADLIMQFIERARQTEPRGQVLLADRAQAADTLLEDGDVLRVPERSNLVLVSGEVLLPNALVWDPKASFSDYIQRAGGYNQDEDDARVVVLRQDGSVSEPGSKPLNPGDEVMVLPKIEAKSVEITRGITQIIYQLAVAAKVILDF